MSTVAVDEGTHQRLLLLKDEWAVASLNDVVRRLLDQAKPLPKSMFGVDPDLPELTPALRAELWGEDAPARKGGKRR